MDNQAIRNHIIEVSAPARICFYGDHQDYLGLPVIAGAIDRFIHIKGTPNQKSQLVIFLSDLGELIRIPIEDALEGIEDEDYFRSSMAVLRANGITIAQGYDIELSGTVPLNAGLSSSSALVVAWIRFLLTAQGGTYTDEQVGQWAYEAEVGYFNQPGGLMDQYTIAQGGLLFIETKTGQTTRLSAKLGTLIIAESGVPKKTLDVLKNARIYAQNAIKAIQKENPKFKLGEAVLGDYEKYRHLVPKDYQDHWYAAIHNYHNTLRAKKELQKPNPDVKILGQLMNEHQSILQSKIQNTPPEMVRMLEAANDAGALGSKTIGSGGGGCMVALVEESTKEKVIKAFLENGAVAAYEVNLITFPNNE